MTFSVQPTQVCKAFRFWRGCIFQWKAVLSEVFQPAPLGTGATGSQQPSLCQTAKLKARSWKSGWCVRGMRGHRMPHCEEGWEPGAWITSVYPYVLSPVELLRLWAELAVATVGDFRGKKNPQCVGMATCSTLQFPSLPSEFRSDRKKDYPEIGVTPSSGWGSLASHEHGGGMSSNTCPEILSVGWF